MISQRPNARDPQSCQSGRRDGDPPSTGYTGAHSITPGVDRRRQLRQETPRAHLEQLPALPLLHRLPTPVLALGLDGKIIYANPAFAGFLGHPDADVLTGQPISPMMAQHANTAGTECVVALRIAAGTMTTWNHVDGYHQHAVVSEGLLLRSTDPALLVTLTDVTDLLWNSNQ